MKELKKEDKKTLISLRGMGYKAFCKRENGNLVSVKEVKKGTVIIKQEGSEGRYATYALYMDREELSKKEKTENKYWWFSDSYKVVHKKGAIIFNVPIVKGYYYEEQPDKDNKDITYKTEIGEFIVSFENDIRVRAWDRDTKVMRDPEELIQGNGILEEGYYDPSGCSHTEDSILMRFTGKYDSDGKRIYEGDIVEINKKKYEVRYAPDWMQFIFLRIDKYGSVLEGKKVTECKIIGNIYQNPDLLKQ